MASAGEGFWPRHWIGVEKEWEAKGKDPLRHLVSLGFDELATHCLVLGATGSGKTTFADHVVAGAALARRSLVVLDLRGDLVASVLEILAAAGTPSRLVEVLDLREKLRPTGFGPLRGAGEPYFAALGVLDAVEAEHDSWGVQLAETARYALMALAECDQPLTRLEALFYDEGFLRWCIAHCRSESLRSFWERYSGASADKRQALAMPVLNKFSMLFATESLRRTFGHPRPLDLGRHLDTPGSVLLVSLAADELHAAGRMAGRMILSCVCREIFSRVGVPEARRNRVLLVADEFQNLVGREFEAILAEGRRFGLSLLAAHQTLSQMRPGMRSLLLGNVGTKVLFRLGREDAAVMSKDLTGDPKALDLASLRTGECVLWKRSGEILNVEVNRPIVSAGGPLSRRADALLRAVQGRYRGFPEGAEPPRLGEPPATGDVPPRQAEPSSRSKKRASGTDLEDWLS